MGGRNLTISICSVLGVWYSPSQAISVDYIFFFLVAPKTIVCALSDGGQQVGGSWTCAWSPLHAMGGAGRTEAADGFRDVGADAVKRLRAAQAPQVNLSTGDAHARW